MNYIWNCRYIFRWLCCGVVGYITGVNLSENKAKGARKVEQIARNVIREIGIYDGLGIEYALNCIKGFISSLFL